MREKLSDLRVIQTFRNQSEDFKSIQAGINLQRGYVWRYFFSSCALRKQHMRRRRNWPKRNRMSICGRQTKRIRRGKKSVPILLNAIFCFFLFLRLSTKAFAFVWFTRVWKLRPETHKLGLALNTNIKWGFDEVKLSHWHMRHMQRKLIPWYLKGFITYFYPYS